MSRKTKVYLLCSVRVIVQCGECQCRPSDIR